jgi:hypothetical protein
MAIFKKKRIGCISRCVTIGQDLNSKAVKEGVSFSDCFKKGVSLTLKELEWGYDIWEKLRKLSEKVEEFSIDNDKLRQKLVKITKKYEELEQKQ